MEKNKIIALRMERQFLNNPANEKEYLELYRDLQPGLNVYWNGFGEPPTLTYRSDFNDLNFNKKRQKDRLLLKGRFVGGNIGWIVKEDLELFAGLFCKPLDKPIDLHYQILGLIQRQGPITIQQIKEETGLLVKQITPVLHRLQEAFLIFEDQYDGEWDRGWYQFSEMFPKVNIKKYSRLEALKIIIPRFAYRYVSFNIDNLKNYYKLPAKDLKEAVEDLENNNILIKYENNWLLKSDMEILNNYSNLLKKSVYTMHRNDFLVRTIDVELKKQFVHDYPDSLFYLLIDGEFKGAVFGKFRFTPPDLEDVILTIPKDEATKRKEEIFKAISFLAGEDNPIKRFNGEEI
ncbi:MAG: hypothetical protein FWE36_03390 [Erysipelotrichales bacterium]|nr:hypothetical protein [Erysipelotrichales bacterium]